MSGLIRMIEELFLPVVSIVCLIVSVGDLFDLFHFVAPEHMPTLSFLLLATILGSLAFLQNRVLELHKELQEFRAETELEQMKHAIDQIDTTLLDVLGIEYFVSIFEFFHTAMKEHKAFIHDANHLLHHVKETFKLYPRGTFFLAISVTACNNSALESALVDFVKSGGKLKCILFVKNGGELASAEVQAFRARLVQLGIQPQHVLYSLPLNNLKINFIVESKGKVAWEMQIDSQGNIHSGTVTVDKNVVARYCQSFKKLLRTSCPA